MHTCGFNFRRPPASCLCPLKQWDSEPELDGAGRLRVFHRNQRLSYGANEMIWYDCLAQKKQECIVSVAQPALPTVVAGSKSVRLKTAR
jgi:hypothetical protein